MFFKELYDNMSEELNDEIFSLEKPWCPRTSQELFDDIKSGYKGHVVLTMQSVLKSNMSEAKKLGNFFLPGLKETLARQRRDYGISDDFEPEFPISELSEDIREKAPINNLAMENACGKVGHRTKKNRHLEATSRSIMIDGTKYLREKYGGTFRDYRDAAIAIKETKTIFNQKQVKIAGEKMSAKQTNNLKIEGRLLKQIEELKEQGGTFTNSLEIDNFLDNSDINEKEKSKRMKIEVMYARDTSLSVPKSNPIFRIRTMKIHGQKSRQLNSCEFGDNLKTLLDKKANALNTKITIKDFVDKLDSVKV